jgi:hypothetical protein
VPVAAVVSYTAHAHEERCGRGLRDGEFVPERGVVLAPIDTLDATLGVNLGDPLRVVVHELLNDDEEREGRGRGEVR